MPFDQIFAEFDEKPMGIGAIAQVSLDGFSSPVGEV